MTDDELDLEDAERYGVMQGEWFALVRRARLSAKLKSAALTVGSYADADGTNVYPGTATLAVDLDCSYSTAQRRLREFRRLGLLARTERVKKPGWSDKYRLIAAPRLLQLVDVPSPDEYRARADALAEHNRRGRRRVKP